MCDSASSLNAHGVVHDSDDCEYERGEMFFYNGASWIFENGDRIVHGQQGEVLGPATNKKRVGKGLSMMFEGNKAVVYCLLTSLSREPPPALSDMSRNAAEREATAEREAHQPGRGEAGRIHSQALLLSLGAMRMKSACARA